MKTRKPRLNTCEGCMTPYRYVMVKITSVNEIGKERNLTIYEVLYTYAEDDYYHDVYGDKVFTNKVYASSMPYKVGNVYRWPMSIDID